MVKAVLFDLDDTLYDEFQFVRGGFKAVSSYVAKEYCISYDAFYNLLLSTLEKNGRGQIFDIAMKEFNLYNDKVIPMLVDIYRKHEPVLSLYPEVKNVLAYLKGQKYRLGLITDGYVQVQRNKIKALDVENYFDCIIISDEYGIDKRKPNVFPYRKAMEILNVKSVESIYIGNDPNKDFFGAKKGGINTFRIMRGQYRDIRLDKEYEADYQINNLDEIYDVFKCLKGRADGLANLPATIWLTGLAASGKTTLANKLEEGLRARGVENVVVLDGEVVRDQLKQYNYSTDDRNILGIQKAQLALEQNKKGNIVIITGIAHHRATREKIRGMFERYYEVYLDCEADICAKRDYKGHYQKAYAGKYEHFIGVTEPYEVSDETELVLKTGEMPIANCAGILLNHVWNFIMDSPFKKV